MDDDIAKHRTFPLVNPNKKWMAKKDQISQRDAVSLILFFLTRFAVETILLLRSALGADQYVMNLKKVTGITTAIYARSCSTTTVVTCFRRV